MEAGYDMVLQAEAGLMSVTGMADWPPVRVGVAITDLAAALFAAVGILSALHTREQSGRGQLVDIGMLDCATSLLTYHAATFFATGAAPVRMGNRHPLVVPYETFSASDGDFVLGVGNDDHWRRCCEAIEFPADPRFATNRMRVEGYDELVPALEQWFLKRPREYWIDRLKSAGVPCGAVRDLPEVFADPQIDARGMVAEVDHMTAGTVRVLGLPVKLSGTPGTFRSGPPTLGQHTDAILTTELGLDADEIARLRSRGIV
jgi:crotonobetainyl-CoA:carnitine CoA-transferase CaiB-like acyl-CoA transferase